MSDEIKEVSEQETGTLNDITAIDKIDGISAETADKIRRKTAFNLPNNPTAAGMSAAEIKKAFYQHILDAQDSVIAEINRIVESTNDTLEQQRLINAIIKENLQLFYGNEKLETDAKTALEAINELNTKKLDKFTEEANTNRVYVRLASGDDGGMPLTVGATEADGSSVVQRNSKGRADISEPEKTNKNGIVNVSYLEKWAPILNAENGIIPAKYLPSYVDDVIEVQTRDALPEKGESGKIYVDVSTGDTYRWSGSAYVRITGGISLEDGISQNSIQQEGGAYLTTSGEPMKGGTAVGDGSIALGKDTFSYQRTSLATGGGTQAGMSEEEFNNAFTVSSFEDLVDGNMYCLTSVVGTGHGSSGVDKDIICGYLIGDIVTENPTVSTGYTKDYTTIQISKGGKVLIGVGLSENSPYKGQWLNSFVGTVIIKFIAEKSSKEDGSTRLDNFISKYFVTVDPYQGRTYDESYSFANSFGELTKALARASMTTGINCIVHPFAHFAFAGGRTCNNYAPSSFIYGGWLENYTPFAAIYGKFNKANTNALFQIGNGTSDSARSNAFEVLRDGTATLGNKKVATIEKNTAGRHILIGVRNNENTQYNFGATYSPTAHTLVYRDDNGNFYVDTPTEESHPTNKKYVDDGLSGKLDKVTDLGYDAAVVINKNNEQIFISINSGVVNHSMMFRDGNGRSKIADPAEDLDIANKRYVDDTNPVKDGVLTVGSVSITSEQLANVLASTGADNKNLFDIMYPIGSIYMTVEDKEPAAMFGGEWEQLQGRFLLGADDTYSLGDTGGETTHNLAVSEIPRHRHSVTFDGNDYVGKNSGTADADISCYPTSGMTSGARNGTLRTELTGGGESHNNMPPYLVVNMWKRTA